MFVWTEIRPLLTHVVIVIVLYRDIDNRCLHLQFIADMSMVVFHNHVFMVAFKRHPIGHCFSWIMPIHLFTCLHCEVIFLTINHISQIPITTMDKNYILCGVIWKFFIYHAFIIIIWTAFNLMNNQICKYLGYTQNIIYLFLLIYAIYLVLCFFDLLCKQTLIYLFVCLLVSYIINV